MTPALNVMSKLMNANISFVVLPGENIASITVKDSVNNEQLRLLGDLGAHMTPEGIFTILVKTV